MTFNITFIGETKSGKTELLKKLCDPDAAFDPHYIATLRFEVKDSADKRLKFIDTAGQERFQLRLDSCIQQADAVLICVDLSQQHDEAAIKAQINHVKTLNPNAHLMVIGTKTDLNATPIDLSSFSSSNHTVSSKENLGIDALKQALLTLGKARNLTQGVVNQSFQVASTDLETALKALPIAKKKKIILAAKSLQGELNSLHGKQTDDKPTLIATFVLDCEKILDHQYPKALKAVLSFGIALFVGAVVAAVGFGIGCAVGAWIPILFIASIKAASAGAIGLIAASGTSAVISGGLAAHSLLKKPASVEKEKQAIRDFSTKL